MDVTTVQPISAYYSSDEDQEDEDVLLYLPIAPEVEEPEDGWNPTIEGMEDGAGVKRGHDQKENSSPKKKRTKSYDISLANAPSDGNKRNSYCLPLFIISIYIHYSHFLNVEVHPLVSSKNKDKPAAVPGKKVAGPGRPRNSDRSDGKRFERSRSGK